MSIEYLLEQLAQNERVLLSTRQHWIFLVRTVVVAALVFIGILVLVLLLDFSWAKDTSWVPYLYLFLLLPGVLIVWRTLQWLQKVYVITNRRVARVKGVLNKNVKDSGLEKVNDIVLSQSVFGRLLNYGSIKILTAAEMGLNWMPMLADPVHFKTTMLDAKEALEREFTHPSAQT
jgi:uncharacterized membrane protein YdbT with pleckstrin-like domain